MAKPKTSQLVAVNREEREALKLMKKVQAILDVPKRRLVADVRSMYSMYDLPENPRGVSTYDIEQAIKTITMRYGAAMEAAMLEIAELMKQSVTDAYTYAYLYKEYLLNLEGVPMEVINEFDTDSNGGE